VVKTLSSPIRNPDHPCEMPSVRTSDGVGKIHHSYFNHQPFRSCRRRRRVLPRQTSARLKIHAPLFFYTTEKAAFLAHVLGW
jgi:hypothetical protein